MWLYLLLPLLYLPGLAAFFLLPRARKDVQFRFPFLRGIPRRLMVISLLLPLLFDLLAFGVSYGERKEDTAAKGYLPRKEVGGSSYERVLRYTAGQDKGTLTVTVPSRTLSPAEAEEALREAEARLDAWFSEPERESGIRADLSLPLSLEGLPVTLLWSSSDGGVLGSDGVIGPQATKEGVPVELSAHLTADPASAVYTVRLQVFAREEEDLSVPDRLTAAIRASDDRTKEQLALPSSLRGTPVRWSYPASAAGPFLLFAGCLAPPLLWLAFRERQTREERLRHLRLSLDYPALADYLTLYLRAGMSLRGAVLRIAADYAALRREGGRMREGFELFRGAAMALNGGAAEAETYRAMGDRSGHQRYRTLAHLMTEHLERGNDALTATLRREADDAFSERIRAARILGEQAGTRLLLPMTMMLLAILLVTTVPAFLSMME